MQEYGYGIDCEKVRWKMGWADTLVEEIACRDPGLRSQYREWMKENMDEPGAGYFADDYVNGTYLYGGPEGLLADAMNRLEFQGREWFRYEDQCIYVPATIPKDEWDRMNLPSQKQIRSILKKYLGRLTEAPATAEWLQVNLG